MKYTPSAVIGFLPRIANSTAIVTSVNAIAISGEAIAIVAERSARFSSTNCIAHLLGAGATLDAGAAHEQAEHLARCVRRAERCRQPAVEHHGDAVGNLGKLVEILADDQHGGAAAGKVDQCLTNGRCRPGIDAPGRLTDHQYPWLAQDFAANNEFLQIAAGKTHGL